MADRKRFLGLLIFSLLNIAEGLVILLSMLAYNTIFKSLHLIMNAKLELAATLIMTCLFFFHICLGVVMWAYSQHVPISHGNAFVAFTSAIWILFPIAMHTGYGMVQLHKFEMLITIIGILLFVTLLKITHSSLKKYNIKSVQY